jgi:hypothetical protein
LCYGKFRRRGDPIDTRRHHHPGWADLPGRQQPAQRERRGQPERRQHRKPDYQDAGRARHRKAMIASPSSPSRRRGRTAATFLRRIVSYAGADSGTFSSFDWNQLQAGGHPRHRRTRRPAQDMDRPARAAGVLWVRRSLGIVLLGGSAAGCLSGGWQELERWRRAELRAGLAGFRALGGLGPVR